MRSAWSSLNKAVTELNTFKQLLSGDQNHPAANRQQEISDTVNPITKSPNSLNLKALYTQASHESIPKLTPSNTLDDYAQNDHDHLASFTNSIISHYTYGSNLPSPAGETNTRDVAISFDANVQPTVYPPTGDSLSTSIGLYHRTEILYHIAAILNKLWTQFLPQVRQICRFKHFDPTLSRPAIWNSTGGVFSEHTDEIIKWLETSANVLYALVTTLNLDKESFSGAITGSDYLQWMLQSVPANRDENYNSAQVWQSQKVVTPPKTSDIRHECRRLIAYIAQLQTATEARINDLARQRDEALASATSTLALQAELSEYRSKAEMLESQLQEATLAVNSLTSQLSEAQDTQISMIHQHQQLSEAVKSLQLEREGVISKTAIEEMLKVYYQASDSKHRQNALDTLADAIGMKRIRTPMKAAQEPRQVPRDTLEPEQGQRHVDLLVQQFIRFVDDETTSEKD